MNKYIVGVDEVGRGSLVGSVIICAFKSQNSLFEEFPFKVRDSKKISKIKRERIFKENNKLNFSYKIVFGKKRDIEKTNIHKVVLDSMSRAVKSIANNQDQVIIDGSFIPKDLMNYNVSSMVKADDKIEQVSAASIIAKVFRDKLMTKLHSIENFYEWNKNAGYGTKNHLSAVNKVGVSQYHRKTYQPICQLITKLST
jgi:ribonuclease HII